MIADASEESPRGAEVRVAPLERTVPRGTTLRGMELLSIALGLTGLFAGGELLVRGSLGLASRLRLPPLLLGLTIVGFGTSTPELVVSLDAALRGSPAIAVGNVVGSNIANVLLIVGICALLWPIGVAQLRLRRDLAVMLAASVALVPAFALGTVGRPFGIALLAGLVLYLVLAARHGGNGAPGADVAVPELLPASLQVTGGLVALVLGARALVDGSLALARSAGVSEAFIGISIVAVGTSLPELATSLVAAYRGRPAIAVGNVVGSNVFNVLGILGGTAVVAPVPVTQRLALVDLPVMIAASLVLSVLVERRPVIGRGAGVAMLVAYAGYLRWSFG